MSSKSALLLNFKDARFRLLMLFVTKPLQYMPFVQLDKHHILCYTFIAILVRKEGEMMADSSKENSIDKLPLDYFYGSDSTKYAFVKIPKELISNEMFNTLTSDAKIIYGLLLDRVSLSTKNDSFKDQYGRVYIYFKQSDITEKYHFSPKVIVKAMKNLENYGLIERIKQGQGKPTKIYVKNFATLLEREAQMMKARNSAANPESTEGQVLTFPKGKSELFQKGSLEYPFKEDLTSLPDNSCHSLLNNQVISKGESLIYNKTEMNKTEMSETNLSNPSLKVDSIGGVSTKAAVERMVKAQINYGDLLIYYSGEGREQNDKKRILQNILLIIIDVFCYTGDTIRIGSNNIPIDDVITRYQMLEYDHILDVIDSFYSAGKVSNPLSYLRTMLYNIPSTYDSSFINDINQIF